MFFSLLAGNMVTFTALLCGETDETNPKMI